MKKTKSENRKREHKWLRSYRNRYFKSGGSVKRDFRLSGLANKFNGVCISDTCYANHVIHIRTFPGGKKYRVIVSRDNLSLNRCIDKINDSRTEIDYNLENIETIDFYMSIKR